jgi:ADP-ribosylation factor GTPase-activating protein 2/3
LKLTTEDHAHIHKSKSEDETVKPEENFFGEISAPKSVAQPPQTVFTSLPVATTSLAQPVEAATVTSQIPQISKAIGTLNIDAAVNATEKDEAVAPDSTEALKAISKLSTSKKPIAAKKGLGAKKLTTTPADTRLESFETVEKRMQLMQKEAEDRKSAKPVESGETSSSKLTTSYKEPEEPPKTSIYRTAVTSPAASSTGSSSMYRSTTSTSQSSTSANESYAARDRYANVKSISSDQFFGRDQENAAELKAKLEKFSGSQAISSDMLYSNNYEEDEYAYRPRDQNSDDFFVDKLKDSVSGFFKDIQKHLG